MQSRLKVRARAPQECLSNAIGTPQSKMRCGQQLAVRYKAVYLVLMILRRQPRQLEPQLSRAKGRTEGDPTSARNCSRLSVYVSARARSRSAGDPYKPSAGTAGAGCPERSTASLVVFECNQSEGDSGEATLGATNPASRRKRRRRPWCRTRSWCLALQSRGQ